MSIVRCIRLLLPRLPSTAAVDYDMYQRVGIQLDYFVLRLTHHSVGACFSTGRCCEGH